MSGRTIHRHAVSSQAIKWLSGVELGIKAKPLMKDLSSTTSTRPVGLPTEARNSWDTGSLNAHHATLGRPCHITFRACTNNIRSRKLTITDGISSQKRRSHDHDTAARRNLEHQDARAIVARIIPRPDMKKQSSGVHKSTKDIEAARVGPRSLRRMTWADYDCSG
jgi:hypothetical protein